MKKLDNLLLLACCMFAAALLFNPESSLAKKRNRQTIDLEGADIDGEVRTPTGDYVLQKSGVDFLPLYEKKKEMNKEIKKTVHFLR